MCSVSALVADVFVDGCDLDNFSLILFIQLSFLADRLTASEHGCGPSGNGSITILPVVTSLEATMSGASRRGIPYEDFKAAAEEEIKVGQDAGPNWCKNKGSCIMSIGCG